MMKKAVLAVLASLLLSSCYETVYEKREREKLEDRVKQLERDRER